MALGAIDHRRIASQDLPTAGAQKGAVAVNGNGLAMSGDTLSLNKGAATSSSGQLVTYDDQGLVVSGAAIQSSDLPLGSDSQVGAVMPGSGLSVGVDGALNHANSVVSGTAPKITFDTEGHVTAGQALLPSDIPDLPASKITSGQFGTPYIADESITLPKLADYSIAYIQEAQPSTVDPGHIGVLWYQESTAQLRMWNGNSFRPIGFGRLSQENLRWGGTVDASTGLIAGVTEAGTTGGLKIGDAVPPASDQLGGLYLVVSVAGNSISETPGITYDAGDWCLCVNATEGWIRIDTLNGGGGGGASSLGDLLDVTLTAEAAGEFIQLQANGQWQNIELEPGTIGALKPGDNVSELVNDAGYLVPGDDVSELNNDAGYITSGDIPAGANLWTEDTGKVYPTNLSNHVQIGGTAADPNIELNADGSIICPGTLSPAGLPGNATSGYGIQYRGSVGGVEIANENNPAVNLNLSGSNDGSALSIKRNGVWVGSIETVDGDICYDSRGTDSLGNPTNIRFRTKKGDGSTTNERMRVDGDTGNFLIGGTIPSAPNISLNADGSGEFSNNQTIQFRPTLADGTSAYALRLLDSTDAAVWQVNADGDSFQVGSHSINGNITLNALDGSATFNSTGQFGGSWSNDDSPQVRAFIGSNVGSVRVKGSALGGASSNAFGVYAGGSSVSSQTYGVYYDGHVEIGGTIPSAPNISLNADGSVEAGSASFDGDTIVPLRVGSQTGTTDYGIRLQKSISNVPTYGDVYLTDDGITFGTGVSTDQIRDPSQIVQIKNGTVKIGGTLPGLPNISLNANGNVSTNGYVFSNRTSQSTTCFRGTLNGATTFEVDARGQATFGSDSNNQVFISSTGDLTSTRTSGSSSVLIAQTGGVTQGKMLADGSILCGGTFPSSPNISLNASDGSAEFAGTITNNTFDDTKNTTTNAGCRIGSQTITIQTVSNATGISPFRQLKGSVPVFATDEDGSVLIGGALPSAPNIELNADGTINGLSLRQTPSGTTNIYKKNN